MVSIDKLNPVSEKMQGFLLEKSMEENMKICYDKHMKTLEALPWGMNDKKRVIKLIYGLTQAVYQRETDQLNTGGATK